MDVVSGKEKARAITSFGPSSWSQPGLKFWPKISTFSSPDYQRLVIVLQDGSARK